MGNIKEFSYQTTDSINSIKAFARMRAGHKGKISPDFDFSAGRTGFHYGGTLSRTLAGCAPFRQSANFTSSTPATRGESSLRCRSC
jgi:hypothetical protein